ncbi:hypothetical protein KR074_006998 [Drosophila pseudoananassae]|nr:hypothetical protein KR074_006998 [Drosophila pseudoananassae]
MDCPKWILGGLCLISWASASTLIELLGRIRQELDFEYLLLLKNRNYTLTNGTWNESTLPKDIMEELSVPVVQLDEQVTYFFFNNTNNRVISLVLVNNNNVGDHRDLLKALVSNLRHMTTTRVMFLIQMPRASETMLYELFSNCWKMRLLNVMALFGDYELTKTFYGYSPFPTLRIMEHLFESEKSVTFYPDRLRNFRGFQLPVIIGGTAPRIIPYYDTKGQIVYDGTVGHFMMAFQQKYNCSFVQPLIAKNPLEFAPSMQTVKAVRNNSVEMSMSLTFPPVFPPFGFSYPYEQLNWCLMMPLEADVPPLEYYTRVFELAAFLLTLGVLVIISCLLASSLWLHGYPIASTEFVLHDSCLRGVLGQSFVEVLKAPTLVRGIYLEICVLGILITAWYNSYFSSYVTTAPKQPEFRSYDDILASRMKVVAWKPEYAELFGRLLEFRKYEPMFYVEPDFSKYLALRDSLDTRYGYMIPNGRWLLIKEQQKIFCRPLFRMRDDFCFYNNIPFGFPINENSVFMEPVLRLIMVLAESGLSFHWMETAFLEMIQAGEMHFLDLSQRREFRAMQAQDLQYIWYGFGFMAVLSSIVWILENICYRLRGKTHLLKVLMFWRKK